MMTFSSSSDLSRLSNTDPAHPVISTLTSNLFTDNEPVTIALMESHDTDHPLAELCNAEDVSLEGILQKQGMYLIALETDYGYGIVLVIPDDDFLTSEMHQCIEQNLYN